MSIPAWVLRFAEPDRPELTLVAKSEDTISFEGCVLTVNGEVLDHGGPPEKRADRLKVLREAINVQPPTLAIVVSKRHLIVAKEDTSESGMLRSMKSLPLTQGLISVELVDDVAILRVFSSTDPTHTTMILRSATGGADATARLMSALLSKGDGAGDAAASTDTTTTSATTTMVAVATTAEAAEAAAVPLADSDSYHPPQCDTQQLALTDAHSMAEERTSLRKIHDLAEQVGGVDARASLITAEEECRSALEDEMNAASLTAQLTAQRSRFASLNADLHATGAAKLDAMPLRAACVYLAREEIALRRIEAKAMSQSAAQGSTSSNDDAVDSVRVGQSRIAAALARLRVLEQRVTQARKAQVPPKVTPKSIAATTASTSSSARGASRFLGDAEQRKRALWAQWKALQLQTNAVARESREALYLEMADKSLTAPPTALAADAAHYVDVFALHDDAKAIRR